MAWLPEGTRGFQRRLQLFATQGTLYHEIGHSFHQHSEPGQVAEQEDEANAYKHRMLRRAYPVTTFCLRLLVMPMRFVLRFFVRHSKRKHGRQS